MIAEGFPLASKFIKNELQAIDYLRNDKTVREKYFDFYNELNNTFLKFNNSTSRKINFESFLDNIPVESKIRAVHVGFHLESNNQDKLVNSSYYLAFCETNKPSGKILRKFHFDFAIVNQRNTPQPIFHIQYCGDLSKYLSEKNAIIAHMDPWLSVPRIFFTPITFAILLNLLFKENGNAYLNKIKEDQYWRKLVIESENMVMKPYFKKCNQFIVDRENNKHNALLTTEYFYAVQ